MRSGTLLMHFVMLYLLLAARLFAVDLTDAARRLGVPLISIDVTAEMPHDTSSFTQGLELSDGVLYEGTGLYARSKLRKLDPKTGEVIQSKDLPAGFFGEGITISDGRLIQLTWQEHTAFVYDPKTFELLTMWAYSEDGWGITSDGKSLIMTDGSPRLLFRSPADFTLEKVLTVNFGQGRLGNLNELEFAQGRIYANILGADNILEIDPATGEATGLVDGTALRAEVGGDAGSMPMNGIAYDKASGEFLVTGKLWPKIFRIKLNRETSGR